MENLTGNPDLDWVSRAAMGVLSAELAGSEHIQPMEVGSVTDIAAAKATAALAGYLESYKGQLRYKAVIRDVATSRTVRTLEAAGPVNGGVLPLFNATARQISTSPRPFPTSNETAVREYFQAITTHDGEQASAHLEASIQADPHFAAPYFAQIERLSAKGDMQGARSAVQRAKQAAAQFSPVDRSRLHLLDATFNNDLPGRTSAMAELATLQTGDVELRKNLSELYLAQKNYRGAAQTLEEAAKITPGDPAIWNALGYAYGYAGDLNSALRSFGQYKQLAPGDANALDSVAEVLFYTGNFADAEKNFIAAHEKDAARFGGIELYRAAVCSLAMGDISKADELFGKYAEFRKQDPGMPMQSAIWKYESGRTKEAIAAMQQMAANASSKDLASVAHTQLSIWYVDAGDRDKARAEAQAAAQSAASAQPKNLAVAAAFMALPSTTAEEWRIRADRLAPNPAQNRLKQQLLAASLLFDRHFPEAITAWRDLYETASPAGSMEAPVFLASAYSQAGQKDEAAKLIRAGVVPPRTPEPGLNSLAVAKYFSMRKQFAK